MMGGGQAGPTGAQMTGAPAPDYAGVHAGMKRPLDWSQLGTMGNGDAARQQAIDASYGQMSSRLDPMWNQREDRMRTQLLNQGLDPGSEAYDTGMANLGRERNDAYTSALNASIGQGTAAGDSVFRNNLQGRQQQIAEMLKARSLPMQELKFWDDIFTGANQRQDETHAEGLRAGGDFLSSLVGFL